MQNIGLPDAKQRKNSLRPHDFGQHWHCSITQTPPCLYSADFFTYDNRQVAFSNQMNQKCPQRI